jgi:hypothetical protein
MNYLADDDVYRCPAGERLTYRFTTKEDGKVMRVYWFGGWMWASAWSSSLIFPRKAPES